MALQEACIACPASTDGSMCIAYFIFPSYLLSWPYFSSSLAFETEIRGRMVGTPRRSSLLCVPSLFFAEKEFSALSSQWTRVKLCIRSLGACIKPFFR